MEFLIVLIGISFLGVGLLGWVLYDEHQKKKHSPHL